MSEPTGSSADADREKPLNEARVALYERLMEAQERIAHARYAQGVADDAVLAAMDTAETDLSEDERREDLYIASLSAYVRALGGCLEVRAVFPEETIVVRRDSTS
jgi:hypothetical protein